jgi:hypothetical protein
MFGWWAAPYDYDRFKWEPMDYGVAFSAVRRGLINAFPGKKMAFGLVGLRTVLYSRDCNHTGVSNAPFWKQ